MIRCPKLSVYTQKPFTQPPLKLFKAYTIMNAKTLQPEGGLPLESHVMLRDSSHAGVNVGSHENKHYHFLAHFINQHSTGF